ncbi:winged helix-turn-helix domain-containing protein [Salinibius halmophilus]|uniref:winged helix-turn-helix domain-containing protein n=1 Tax=Salinibius halmophilus TaxID=1853216 RepID=UPI000E67220F|nr:response regulator transcription factor [Salinibius halmophilus]
MKILVIEDDASVAKLIVEGLTEHGHDVNHSADGADGLATARDGGYDVMVVDRMLPAIDGLEVIETLRQEGNQTPALVLSALGDVEQRVEGLKAGSDDYLPKPFALSELLARIEAIARRGGDVAEVSKLEVANLSIDLQRRQAWRDSTKIHLQQREFRLLEYLMRNHGKVVTRTMLLENVWDYNFDPQTNVIDVHISRLRQKVDRDFEPKLIHTVRGAGYVLAEDPSAC